MDQIVARYAERRVPRYTSYPTAPHFAAAPDDSDYRSWLAGLDPAAPLSLYVHVPFCKQVCWYCACNMKLAVREAPVIAYGQSLEQEIGLVADAMPQRMNVHAIHWGGGTPTAMPMPALEGLMARLRQRFEVAANAEIAFELDPRTFEPAMAEGLAALGTTRASLGVQEFDLKVQQAVNRIQPYETVRQTVQSLREAGIQAINFDLMYGLPHQSVASLTHSIDRALQLSPDRIALFGYAHVPWIAKRQRVIAEDTLPGVNERFDQAERAAEALVKAGYIRIGLDHFAKPGDAMARAAREGTLRRNFQGYTVDDAGALVGLGATSISSLPQGYVQNIAETGAYQRMVADHRLPVARICTLTEDDRLRRDIIERLMCDCSVDLAAISERHGIAPEVFAPELAQCQVFAGEKLLVTDGWRIAVTEKGRPALRVICALFDTYLPLQPSARRHAAAV